VGIAGEVSLPRRVAQDDDLIVTGPFILQREPATNERRYAEHRKRLDGHGRQLALHDVGAASNRH